MVADVAESDFISELHTKCGNDKVFGSGHDYYSIIRHRCKPHSIPASCSTMTKTPHIERYRHKQDQRSYGRLYLLDSLHWLSIHNVQTSDLPSLLQKAYTNLPTPDSTFRDGCRSTFSKLNRTFVPKVHSGCLATQRQSCRNAPGLATDGVVNCVQRIIQSSSIDLLLPTTSTY